MVNNLFIVIFLNHILFYIKTARMRLSNNVENKDVDFAISVMLESFI